MTQSSMFTLIGAIFIVLQGLVIYWEGPAQGSFLLRMIKFWLPILAHLLLGACLHR